MISGSGYCEGLTRISCDASTPKASLESLPDLSSWLAKFLFSSISNGSASLLESCGRSNLVALADES